MMIHIDSCFGHSVVGLSLVPWGNLLRVFNIECTLACSTLDNLGDKLSCAHSLLIPEVFAYKLKCNGSPSKFRRLIYDIQNCQQGDLSLDKLSIAGALTFLELPLINCGSWAVVGFDSVQLGVCFQSCWENNARLVENVPGRCVRPILSSTQLRRHAHVSGT